MYIATLHYYEMVPGLESSFNPLEGNASLHITNQEKNFIFKLFHFHERLEMVHFTHSLLKYIVIAETFNKTYF